MQQSVIGDGHGGLTSTPVQLSDVTIAAFRDGCAALKPPPKLTMTEWAERNFRLAAEDGSIAGRFRVDRAPYQREILDCILNPEVKEVVLCCASQMVKTTAIKIWLAYFMVEDPSPIIFVLPDLEYARAVSQQRLTPMFRDMPIFKGILETGANKAGNKTLTKIFPGGFLRIVGSNAPASLSGMPARIRIMDERNRFAPSAGDEGDQGALANVRQSNFWNAKGVASSTPTDDHGSITEDFDRSSQEYFYVPCPSCNEYQTLKWPRLQYGGSFANSPFYVCEHNGCEIPESARMWMLERGEWRAHNPAVTDVRGFHINALYSPLLVGGWTQLVKEWREANANRHDNGKLKVFVNTRLAEPFNDDAEKLDDDELMGRLESYPCPVPDGGTILTASVDVQPDRLEAIVRAWGKGLESWIVDRLVFRGDTSVLKGPGAGVQKKAGEDVVEVQETSPWERLDQWHERALYLHARGVRLPISCMLVDSGDQTDQVYMFCRPRRARWIFATKGVSGFTKPTIGEPNVKNKKRMLVYPIGVDQVKSLIYKRLKIGLPGAGYMHFSRELCDKEYFQQLTCEKLTRKHVRGFAVRQWEKPSGARNEALDLEVLVYAALIRIQVQLAPKTGVDELLRVMREQLLERAKYAAMNRRAHVDPNQLALLAPPADDTPKEDATGDDLPAAESVQTPAEAPPAAEDSAEPDAGLGAHEHKAAEVLDVDGKENDQAPAQEWKPRVSWKPGGWI